MKTSLVSSCLLFIPLSVSTCGPFKRSWERGVLGKWSFTSSRLSGRSAYVSTTVELEPFQRNLPALVALYMILGQGAGVMFYGRRAGEAIAGLASPVLVYICGHLNGRIAGEMEVE